MDDQIEYMNYLFNKRDEAFSNLFSNLFQASVAFVALAVPLLSVMQNKGWRFYLCGAGSVCAMISIILSGMLMWYNMHRYREAIKQYDKCLKDGCEFEGTNESRLIRFCVRLSVSH